MLFTDVVGSTQRATALGDAAWAELLARHDSAVRGELARFGGEEIDTAGDGFLAQFDGPARAIRCGLAVRDALGWLGLDVRCGIHTGEVEREPGAKPRGIRRCSPDRHRGSGTGRHFDQRLEVFVMVRNGLSIVRMCQLIGHALHRTNEQGQIRCWNPARSRGHCGLGRIQDSRGGAPGTAGFLAAFGLGVGKIERRAFVERQVMAAVPATRLRLETQVVALCASHRGPSLSSRGVRTAPAVANNNR